jgi:hypothetical protein
MIGLMEKHWIPAATALAILEEVSGSTLARLALCSRAHHGLVATKAHLFTSDSERRPDAVLPTGFWWAEGHEALEQNWSAGDFSTWIKQTTQLKAFGVQFDLDGVLSLVPTDRHARLRLELSVRGSAEGLLLQKRVGMSTTLGA